MKRIRFGMALAPEKGSLAQAAAFSDTRLPDLSACRLAKPELRGARNRTAKFTGRPNLRLLRSTAGKGNRNAMANLGYRYQKGFTWKMLTPISSHIANLVKVVYLANATWLFPGFHYAHKPS
jgi:hypothetical protein